MSIWIVKFKHKPPEHIYSQLHTMSSLNPDIYVTFSDEVVSMCIMIGAIYTRAHVFQLHTNNNLHYPNLSLSYTYNHPNEINVYSTTDVALVEYLEEKYNVIVDNDVRKYIDKHTIVSYNT